MEPLYLILSSSIILAVLLAFSLLKKEKSQGERFFLFWSIAIVSVFATAVLIIDTVQENLASVTGGPVHWHADYKILSCLDNPGTVKGALLAHNEIELKDPKGIANRVGTSLLHEHNDNRIHIEGTVRELSDINLARFFETIGGQLTATTLHLPTNEEIIHLENGLDCNDGRPGALQVFLYKTNDGIVTQEKLENFPEYVISPYSTIPPGDCLIFEFIPETKNRTENICDFYQVAIEKGDLKYAR